MKEESKLFTTDEVKRAMSTSRIIKAPRQRVFQLFTTDKIDQWYGPKGCYIETSEMEVEEGGQWNYTMYMPNDKSFDAFHTYTKVVEPEKLVFVSAQHPDAPDDQWFTTEIEFIDLGGETEVKVTMKYKTDTMFDQAKQQGAIRGYVSALKELQKYVESTD